MSIREALMTRHFGYRILSALAALVLVVSQGVDLGGQVGPPADVPGIDKPVRVVRGRITTNTTLTSDAHYVLRGAVFVAEGTTLTIQAGTRVVGETATLGTLVVERGGRLVAAGTPTAPIVFTSDQPVGGRARGDWGGLIINGRAPVNLPGGVGIGEGDTGEYGGSDPNDNSGILRYVRVEYAGIEFSPDNELNGIAFQGVGRGTVVDHVQVKHNKDDGVEFFGGTVDAKHLLLTSIGDDSLDWTFGWIGRVQYVVAQQSGDDADNGFEADNNANNNDLLPRSAPTIFNATLIGDPDRNEGSESDDGFEIREGTAGIIRNFIIMGFKENGIDYDGASTIAQAQAGALSLSHGIVFNNATLTGANFDSTSRPFLVATPTIVIADPGLADPYNHDVPNFRPASVATLAGGQLTPAVPPNDGFFEVTTFIGALSPDPAQDWTVGWTSFDRR
jgi:hypothetical protein